MNVAKNRRGNHSLLHDSPAGSHGHGGARWKRRRDRSIQASRANHAAVGGDYLLRMNASLGPLRWTAAGGKSFSVEYTGQNRFPQRAQLPSVLKQHRAICWIFPLIDASEVILFFETRSCSKAWR